MRRGGGGRLMGTARRAGATSTFSQEAVREFRVSVQNYSAVYGHGAGGLINTVSKSGTNGMHGAGFYLARTSAWGAANPLSRCDEPRQRRVVTVGGVVKPNDLRQQFGGSVGGPLMRDRLFYFYTTDFLRRNYPHTRHRNMQASMQRQRREGLLGARGEVGGEDQCGVELSG